MPCKVPVIVFGGNGKTSIIRTMETSPGACSVYSPEWIEVRNLNQTATSELPDDEKFHVIMVVDVRSYDFKAIKAQYLEAEKLYPHKSRVPLLVLTHCDCRPEFNPFVELTYIPVATSHIMKVRKGCECLTECGPEHTYDKDSTNKLQGYYNAITAGF